MSDVAFELGAACRHARAGDLYAAVEHCTRGLLLARQLGREESLHAYRIAGALWQVLLVLRDCPRLLHGPR